MHVFKFIPVLVGICFLPSTLLAQNDSLTSSEKEQIKAAVREWVLNKTLEQPESYKDGEFSEFERIIDLSDEAKLAYYEWVDGDFEALSEIVGDTSNHEQSFDEDVLSESKSNKRLYDSFKKEPIGFSVKHTFRAKSGKDATLYYECEFKLNTAFEIYESSVKERYRSTEKTG